MELPDLVLGRYRVEGLLGEGGMGLVFRGRHAEVDLPVAIKVILGEASASLRARFVREAQLMAKVRHPNVVAFHDFGILPTGEPCIVMALVEGEPLDEYIDRKRALAWPEVVEIASDILEGLAAVHALGIVHRDLKDANVMLSTPPGSQRRLAQLLDFGIARPDASFEKLTKTGSLLGTPHFMAPEQVTHLHAIDHRVDLFALGVMMFEMLSGLPPWEVDSHAALFRRVQQEPPLVKAAAHLEPLPPRLVETVARLLKIDPSDRPADARATLQLLTDTAAAPMAPRTSQKQTARGGAARIADTIAVAEDAPQPWLLAARVPARKLRQKSLRQQLAALLPIGGRGYTLGAELWFATLPEDLDASQRVRVDALRQALTALLGEVPIEDVGAGPDFRLPASALAGATPLPATLQRLVTRLLA